MDVVVKEEVLGQAACGDDSTNAGRIMRGTQGKNSLHYFDCNRTRENENHYRTTVQCALEPSPVGVRSISVRGEESLGRWSYNGGRKGVPMINNL